jgi:arylformamidase
LHDLVPISRCYLQQSLNLSDEEVERNSPVNRAPPREGEWLAVVGAKEGPEYHRQSTTLAERWSAAGCAGAGYRILEGHDHFSIMMALDNPEDPLTRLIAKAAA